MPKRVPEGSKSVVSERLLWLKGRTVRVRLTFYEAEATDEHEFTAVYKDTYPLGSGYFFLFDQKGKQRLVATTAVREISPVD